MNKVKLCEAVRSIKKDYAFSYKDMCSEESPVNTTQLGNIIKRNGKDVSIERIIALLEYYGLTVNVTFEILNYKEGD